MAVQVRSPFAGKLSSAKANMGGFWFLEGKYRVRIKKCSLITSRKGDQLYIVECLVLASNNPARPVGCEPSWVVKTAQDAAPGNIKLFMAAVQGLDIDDEYVNNTEVDETGRTPLEVDFDDTYGDDQPLAGVEVDLLCEEILTKDKRPFTKHLWKAVEA